MTTVRWPASLRELDLFAECSDEELRRADALMTPTEIAPGQAFIKEGRLGREAVIIADGLARVTVGGREVAAVGAGDVVGEMSLLNGGARSATVTALTPVAAYVCTPSELTALCATAPSVDRIIRHRAAARTRANMSRRRRPVGADRSDRSDRPDRRRLALWRPIELPGRGTTFACDLPGPSPDAPAVVMLHGLGATGALNWGYGLDVLNERFRVVALDHRGHGRGIEADEPFTLEDCADDAVALADVVGVERAIFVGYSMGGPIAQLVWHRHAERVQGLVLCATSAEFCSPAERWAIVRALEEVHRTTRLIPRPLVVESTRAALAGFLVGAEQRQDLLDAVSRHDPVSVRDAAQAVLSFSSTDWIGEASVPTAVVVTERDHLVPTARQRELAARIPGATVVALDGNHMVFLTEPEALAAAVLEACRAVSAAALAVPAPAGSTRWRGRRARPATRYDAARGWPHRQRSRA
jgi:pimeloyl-ACP methyl ester carboxylesterase/CRP-like cAMP-binding protein